MGNSTRGFASFSPEKRKAIASRAGHNSQASGKGHRWDKKEASEAGKIGGKNRWIGKKKKK